MRLPALLAAMPVLLAAQAAASPDPLEALVRDSPFLPASGAGAGAPATAVGPLEFRSVVFEQGQYFFSIYDQGTHQSRWVGLGPGDAPFVARSYNREQDILTVEHQGRSLTLKLQEGRIAGQPAGTPNSNPAPLPTSEETARKAGGPSPANANPPAPNAAAAPAPAPAANPAEGQRLQELADELRRRRQMPAQPPKS